MGWQDREYAKGGGSYRPAWVGAVTGSRGGRSVVTKLIWINAAVFVLCTLTSQGASLARSPFFAWTALFTPAVMHGEVWRLLTAQYLHWGFSHILMNMIGLHFLGRALERDWGPKRFFIIYTVAGTLGNLFYVLLTLWGWLPRDGIAAGASGCVLGLLGAAAVRYPHAQVYIYFLFPIKIRTAALVFGGWYGLNLFNRGSNAGGDACHLAGMVFGAWWAWRGEGWWQRTQWRMPRGRLRVRKVQRGGFAAKVEQRREDVETIDRILKKVYEGGIHNLSDREKQSLQAATERQRQREADAGRIDRL